MDNLNQTVSTIIKLNNNIIKMGNNYQIIYYKKH
jgi:hypothetical protein